MDEFNCYKCGVRMRLEEADGKVLLRCSVCGAVREFSNYVEHRCPDCGYDKALVLWHATTIGDEDTTTIYRCIKCGGTSREGFES